MRRTQKSGWRLIALAALCAAAPQAGGAEIIDRVVASVNRTIITRSGLELNLRLAAFLDARPPQLNEAARNAELQREIDQALLRQEMEISRFPQAPLVDAIAQLDKIKAERFQAAGSYEKALQEYELTQDEVEQYIQWQITLLRFIDFRFRPGVQVTDEDVARYYRETFVPDWNRRNRTPAPKLDDVRAQIEERMTSEATDRAVETWLADNRKTSKIVILEEGAR